MNNFTRNQKGSPSRDLFKLQHKLQCPSHFYGCDIDFCIVQKHPTPHIVAVIDYKTSNDDITFSEVIAYNKILESLIPIFIVQGDAETGRFSISQFLGGNWRPNPPDVELHFIGTTSNWSEFAIWEGELRKSSGRPQQVNRS